MNRFFCPSGLVGEELHRYNQMIYLGYFPEGFLCLLCHGLGLIGRLMICAFGLCGHLRRHPGSFRFRVGWGLAWVQIFLEIIFGGLIFIELNGWGFFCRNYFFSNIETSFKYDLN